MRTLDAALTTQQEANSGVPYVKVTFANRANTTTRTYSTNDATNKLILVQQAEGRTDRRLQMPGIDGGFSMLIRVKDADNSVAALDHVGYRCDIDWGFDVSGSGLLSSRGPFGKVIAQTEYSEDGNTFVEFVCISTWDLLSVTPYNIETNSVLDLDGTALSVRHMLMDLLMQNCDAVITDDGGTLVDKTADANDVGADDVLVLPAVPAVNDALYIGSLVRFDRASIDLTTVGVGTWAVVLEYWDGVAWNGLADLDGDTVFTTNSVVAFQAGELQTIHFRAQSDWATTTVNGQGPFFYIRVRVTSFTNVTTAPKATKISTNYDYGIALDTSDVLQEDDIKPVYLSQYQYTTRDIVLHMLSFGLLHIVQQEDGFHARYIDVDAAVVDYSYGLSHPSFNSEYSQSLVLPNKVIVVEKDPALGEASPITGSATQINSITEFGTLAEVIVDPTITDATEGTTQALQEIKRKRRDLRQGAVTAGMNCGQEIWDLVEIIDARTGRTFTGLASMILRTYIPSENVYEISIQLGGAVGVFSASHVGRVAQRKYNDIINQRNAISRELTNQIQQPLTRLQDALLAAKEQFPEEEGIDLPFNVDQALADLGSIAQTLDDNPEFRQGL